MYTSTRNKLCINSKECIEKGISNDGGLFIRNDFAGFVFDKNDVRLSYNELTKKIFNFFFEDYSSEELDEIICKAYNEEHFPNGMCKLKNLNDVSFLELYHGPTMAFKDMALTILPHLMTTAKKGSSKKTLILTATSGDTGGAALSGFLNAEDIKVIVLYPTDGVSKFQEKQMHYYNNDNCTAISVEGNFDDCQSLVKKVFNETKDLKSYELSSANSINIGRLIPQVVYYFYSYFKMVETGEIKFGEKINYIVPTGNFGNILACYIAKKMGLYIDKLVCASNENDVLTEFFNTGVYNKNRNFKVTYSPAMDILISSNLERLLYLICDCDEEYISLLMKELKETGEYKLDKKYFERLNDFIGVKIENEETLDYIKKCYDQYNYLIDPHTAVAFGGYECVKSKLSGKSIVVSTASPFKFTDALEKVFDSNGENIYQYLSKIGNLEIPEVLNNILNFSFDKVVWKKEEMELKLKEMIGEIDEEN